ncbi:unnamed protein product, partial [Symbiodinium sp. KB8]
DLALNANFTYGVWIKCRCDNDLWRWRRGFSVIFKSSSKKESEFGTEDIVAHATVIGQPKDKGRSPDQMKSRSSRSTSRKASAEEVPVSWAFGEGLGDFWRPPVPLARDQSTSHDNADAQLEREVQRQETIRQNLPVLNVFSQPRVLNNQLIDQLRNAEEKMQIFHLATRPIL